MEELKKKFIQKLQESEAKVDATIGKMVALEKTRTQAQAQNSGLRDEIERVSCLMGFHGIPSEENNVDFEAMNN